MLIKKPRITVDLKPDEYQQLKQLKNRMDRSLSWLGRQAICEFLEKHTILPNDTSQKYLSGANHMKGRTG